MSADEREANIKRLQEEIKTLKESPLLARQRKGAELQRRADLFAKLSELSPEEKIIVARAVFGSE
jgi:hypothetical protein